MPSAAPAIITAAIPAHIHLRRCGIAPAAAVDGATGCDGRFSGAGDIRLDPGVDGSTTIVHWSETIVPPQLPHLGARVLAPVLRRVFQADLDRLRDLVETVSRGS